MKPGVKTTEFWLSLLAALMGPIIAILITMGVIGPDVDPTALSDSIMSHLNVIVDAVVQLIGLITPVFVAKSYNASRATVKAATSP